MNYTSIEQSKKLLELGLSLENAIEMDKNLVSVSVKELVYLFIIAMGEDDGVEFEYYPNIPSCFSENINFNSLCGCNADLLRLSVNDLGMIEVWFIDKDESTFWVSFDELKDIQPMLYAAIITHVYDTLMSWEEE